MNWLQCNNYADTATDEKGFNSYSSVGLSHLHCGN